MTAAKKETELEMTEYRPSDNEPFMNDRQREYFRKKLLAWKSSVLKEVEDSLAHLQKEDRNHPDLADRASSEAGWAIELRARDRQRKLIAKIDAALKRLEEDTYGYCLETGEPISLRRLDARPIATHSQLRPRRGTNGTSACTAMIKPDGHESTKTFLPDRSNCAVVLLTWHA